MTFAKKREFYRAPWEINVENDKDYKVFSREQLGRLAEDRLYNFQTGQFADEIKDILYKSLVCKCNLCGKERKRRMVCVKCIRHYDGPVMITYTLRILPNPLLGRVEEYRLLRMFNSLFEDDFSVRFVEDGEVSSIYDHKSCYVTCIGCEPKKCEEDDEKEIRQTSFF